MAKENYQKAYDLRSRVSAREQYAISAYYYYDDVTGRELNDAIRLRPKLAIIRGNAP